MKTHEKKSVSSLKTCGGTLVCPDCGEILSQPDVETFRKCPFCDHLFEEDPEFEDYLLQPVVELWMHSSGQDFFWGNGNFNAHDSMRIP